VTDSAESDFGLDAIGQIAIPVTDVERAIAFYRDVLGMRFLFRAPPGLGFFDCGGVRLMLDGPAASLAGRATVLYYKVEGLADAVEALSSRGVRFESEPRRVPELSDPEVWWAFFRDPDHNLLALTADAG
jgi:methylmalonyl-CoA/ethylmalonyl-CoA epimerase